MAEPPPLMLWAWESPQDLRFLDGHQAGVAYLAATILVSGDQVRLVRRHQPLRTAPGTPLMAVFRIESNPRKAPSGPVADTILREFAVARLTAIQIDFDARRSERQFYRALLTSLRAKLGPSVFISITALASWCEQDSWLDSLPVDEAVPMLFRMGPDRPAVLTRLSNGAEFASPVCRSSSGVSTDEQVPKLGSFRRVYVFHPGPWDAASVAGYLR